MSYRCLTREEYVGYRVSEWTSPEEKEACVVAEIFRFAQMLKDRESKWYK